MTKQLEPGGSLEIHSLRIMESSAGLVATMLPTDLITQNDLHKLYDILVWIDINF